MNHAVTLCDVDCVLASKLFSDIFRHCGAAKKFSQKNKIGWKQLRSVLKHRSCSQLAVSSPSSWWKRMFITSNPEALGNSFRNTHLCVITKAVHINMVRWLPTNGKTAVNYVDYNLHVMLAMILSTLCNKDSRAIRWSRGGSLAPGPPLLLINNTFSDQRTFSLLSLNIPPNI